MSALSEERIPLHISNKTAYVWALDDIAALRATHRICGVLTGTLPHASQQNVFLGVPLTLLPEEVVLLVNAGIASLVDDGASHWTPTPQQLSEWNDHRRQALARVANKEYQTPPPNLSDEALKKRLERQKRKELQTVPTNDAPPANAKEKSYLFTIPGASSFSWYTAKRYSTLKEASEAGVWTYPNTPEESARCAVFHDLWKQGYYMGNGLRFGGDWLVYPGDPLRFHSHFVATVFPSPVSEIQPMQIVAYGRLGTATKKSHLLCGWDENTQKVSYYSIEWAGFG